MTESDFPSAMPVAFGLHAQWYAANAVAATLTAQQCECGVWRHPARYRCPVCRSDVWSFEAVGVEAVVESWTIARRPLHGGFAAVVPYAIVIAKTRDCRFFVHLRPSIEDQIPVGASLILHVDEFGVPYAELAELSE